MPLDLHYECPGAKWALLYGHPPMDPMWWEAYAMWNDLLPEARCPKRTDLHAQLEIVGAALYGREVPVDSLGGLPS